MKGYWLEECRKWFPSNGCNKGRYGAAAIMHASMSPVFLVFSYDYASGEEDFIKPKLIA